MLRYASFYGVLVSVLVFPSMSARAEQGQATLDDYLQAGEFAPAMAWCSARRSWAA